MSNPVETVKASWGPDVPEWIQRLAEVCAASSQRKVAQELSRSGALVNQVLRNSYKGDLKAVERRVRGVFMNGVTACPELGEIPMNACQDWQKKARQFGNANMLRVRMFRACNRCPKNKAGNNNG